MQACPLILTLNLSTPWLREDTFSLSAALYFPVALTALSLCTLPALPFVGHVWMFSPAYQLPL